MPRAAGLETVNSLGEMAYLLRLSRWTFDDKKGTYMNRLFWLMVGMVLGAAAYRYFREQGGEIPGFEPLTERGRRLQERGREFADSARLFAESGRGLAEESRQFAQTALDTAQTRSHEAVDNVKTQASKLQEKTKGTAHRLREDVTEDAGGEMGAS